MLLGLRKPNPYRELEKRLGYKFDHRELLEMALLHRSFRFETRDIAADNQRLEFLGDAVAGFLVAAHLYRQHSDRDEGALTEMRSRVTSGKAMAGVAREIGLGDFMRLGKGEEMAGGRLRETLLADGLEAVIGAAYLDGGVKAAEKVVAKLLIPLTGDKSSEVWGDNPKGKLQELSQGLYGRGPEYRCISEKGPAHQKLFVIEAIVGGARLGQGTGSSKRAAETEAAIVAVRKLLSK
ncbi:MAG: ribonuclease III [bacterium]